LKKSGKKREVWGCVSRQISSKHIPFHKTLKHKHTRRRTRTRHPKRNVETKNVLRSRSLIERDRERERDVCVVIV
jgi:hypothetical protein